MKQVKLSSQDGKIISRYASYSFMYLIFGPFYLILRLRVFSGILLLLVYYYFLPIPGMEAIGEFFQSLFQSSFGDQVYTFLTFFRGETTRYIGIFLVVLFQIIISIDIEGYILKRLLKHNRYLPISEQDARILIKLNACSTDILLAEEGFSKSQEVIDKAKNIDEPYLIDEKKKTELEKIKQDQMTLKIKNLERLYQSGLLKKEEFELQRARIIKNYKK